MRVVGLPVCKALAAELEEGASSVTILCLVFDLTAPVQRERGISLPPQLLELCMLGVFYSKTSGSVQPEYKSPVFFWS